MDDLQEIVFYICDIYLPDDLENLILQFASRSKYVKRITYARHKAHSLKLCLSNDSPYILPSSIPNDILMCGGIKINIPMTNIESNWSIFASSYCSCKSPTNLIKYLLFSYGYNNILLDEKYNYKVIYPIVWYKCERNDNIMHEISVIKITYGEFITIDVPEEKDHQISTITIA